ncbi:VWA domain-containing protein [Actinomadura chibensis]|uniref:VWA domain-containing protein n=1 Tax=Actinomadura chibensis TaxID=392828 RepID=A0A5D0N8X9_9ACTN|nr:VWA domain-containing protein [Actinomadura chibensis]TYB40799.1 VWA domain-containing protein [Actinomadura chibensis]
MPTHVVPAPAAPPSGTGAHPAPTVAAPAPVTGLSSAWLGLSALFTDAVTDLTDREDLTVRCAPGLGHGAPGCYVPSLATIELDGTHLGQPPATCDPTRPADRERYAALWGTLTHEAAHATHTCWSVPADGSSAAAQAAIALEESRIEVAQIRRRPADRRWIRACVTRLVLAEFISPTPAAAASATAPAGEAAGSSVTTPHAAMTPWNAGYAAALLLARTDAGILEPGETGKLAATVLDILGPSRLSALSALWHLAHVTRDDDAETMMDLGRRWCRILGVEPERPTPPPPPGTPGTSGDPSPLAEAIGKSLTAVQATQPAPTTGSPDPSTSQKRREEKNARDTADRAARRVFGASTAATASRGRTAITGTRPPTPDEQAAARRLARQLRAAAHRDRVTTTHTSPTPPGRLSMRGALAADAQRAAGTVPTAEPFMRTVRRHVPAPPLRLGVACDVSGSMKILAAPVASAAWIMARAAGHVPDALSATVIFGSRVRPVTHPGKSPTAVSEFEARDSREEFVQAVDALTSALDLTRPGAARLLVIVSDGLFKGDQPTDGQQRVDRLTASGCAVLWLALSTRVNAMKGAHLVTLTDPTSAADIIGTAATRALRNA